MDNSLFDRCEKFQSELGVPVTRFCKRIQLSTSSYYAAKSGQLGLSKETVSRIDNFLKKYNF